MKKFITIVSTFPTKKHVRKICKILLDKSFVACCQIVGPIESHYVWQGRVEVSKEYLCLIKTTRTKYKTVEKLIKAQHSYTIPEIVAFDISNGHKPYLDWVKKSTKNIK
jgi:periplasmic divalent cation tolerance protein